MRTVRALMRKAWPIAGAELAWPTVQLPVRLPEVVAWVCYEFVRGLLAEEPRRAGAALREPFEGCWRARRSEYRVRHTIDDEAKQVHVLGVDHRREFLPPLTCPSR